MSQQDSTVSQKSWWMRTFGRSIYSLVFGDNLADRNVAATVIGVMLVATICYLAIAGRESKLEQPLVNIVFVVVGFYFGSKRHEVDEENE